MSSVPQKIRILKYTAEQGVVTVDDVVSELKNVSSASSIRVMMHQAGLGRMKYGKVRHGVWFIKEQSHLDQIHAYFPDVPLALQSVNVSQIPHTLELNRIRRVFEESSNLQIFNWISESILRAMPASLRDGFELSNIPDAVFWRKKKDGTDQKYFLEFERSLKSPARYRDIFTNYAKRDDVENKNVIYICKDEFIKNKLQSIEAKLADSGFLNAADKYFQFVTLKGFYNTYEEKHSQQEESTNGKI